jgi:hypothetical protein
MDHVDPGHHLQKFAGHVRSAADTGGCDVDPARIGPRIIDEFGKRVHRQRRMHKQDIRHPHDAGDRGYVAEKNKAEFVIERRVDRGRGDQQQGIAVRRSAHDGLGGDVGARARTVLNDELLAKPLREPLPDQAGHDVVAASGSKTDHQAYRPHRIVKRPSTLRKRHGESAPGNPGKPRGRCGRGEPQKSTARNVHDVHREWMATQVPGRTIAHRCVVANLINLVTFAASVRGAKVVELRCSSLLWGPSER